MPRPYVNATEIEGLMRVLPLYCYFPKSEWKNIQRAEKNDELGAQQFKVYADQYKKEFFKDYQLHGQEIKGAAGCRSNPRDSFRISPHRLDPEEMSNLII